MGWHITSDIYWVGQWVSDHINGSYCAERDTALGLIGPHDSLVAGVLYDSWNGRSIMAHIAVTGCMTSTFLAAIFDYPFNVVGAEKIICPIPSDNARSIRLATNMGFREEARLRDAQPTGDILLFTLTKNDCRFLEDRYGKKQTTSARRA